MEVRLLYVTVTFAVDLSLSPACRSSMGCDSEYLTV